MASVARSLRVPFIAAPMAAIVMPGTALAGAAAKVGLSRLALLGWGAGSAAVVSSAVLAIALAQPTRLAPAPAPVLAPPVHAVSRQAPLEPAAPATVPGTATPSSPPVRAVKEPAPWDEPQLIERARKALASDPRRALALTQEHQRRFPAGALGVERDVIALEALARSGQTTAARRRALAFEAKYPNSIHLQRVRALLARLGAE